METSLNRQSKRPNQISDTVYTHASLDTLDSKFRARFTDMHRRLKAAIHRCQYQAYSDERLVKMEDAEERAKECFLPLMLVRRHASVIMANARDNATKCIEESTKEGTEAGKVKCL